MWSSVLEWLPSSIRTVLTPLPAELTARAEEIRIREGRPLEVVVGERLRVRNAVWRRDGRSRSGFSSDAGGLL